MQRVNLPFYLMRHDSAARYVDNLDEVIGLITQQTVDEFDDQTLSEAIQDDWDDEELRLEVFGPHGFTEETLKDTLDLCEAVEAMNKGYIL